MRGAEKCRGGNVVSGAVDQAAPEGLLAENLED